LEILPWPIKSAKNEIGMYLDASKMVLNKTIPYMLAIDIGLSNCGYAVALMKLKEEDFTTIQIEGLFSVYPTGKTPVDIDGMFEHFIKPMCECLNIQMVLYDRWQSKSQIQALVKSGIKATQYSMTYADFMDFRIRLTQNKLETPVPEMPLDDVDAAPDSLEEVLYPRSYLHFLWQLLSVSEIGRKITKGDGHDDLFRAVTLGAKFLWDEDYRYMFEYKDGQKLNTSKNRLVMSGGSMGTKRPYGKGAALTYRPGHRVLGSVIVKRNK